MTRALEEKQRLIAEILNVPFDDFDHISDMAAESSANRDAREVLLAALEQGKKQQKRSHHTKKHVAHFSCPFQPNVFPTS